MEDGQGLFSLGTSERAQKKRRSRWSLLKAKCSKNVHPTYPNRHWREIYLYRGCFLARHCMAHGWPTMPRALCLSYEARISRLEGKTWFDESTSFGSMHVPTATCLILAIPTEQVPCRAASGIVRSLPRGFATPRRGRRPSRPPRLRPSLHSDSCLPVQPFLPPAKPSPYAPRPPPPFSLSPLSPYPYLLLPINPNVARRAGSLPRPSPACIAVLMALARCAVLPSL